MILGSRLCLVKACQICNGRGFQTKKTAAVQLGTGYETGEPVPCTQCLSGFCFEAASELSVLEALLGALNDDVETDLNSKTRVRQLRQQLRIAVVRATEEDILNKSSQ